MSAGDLVLTLRARAGPPLTTVEVNLNDHRESSMPRPAHSARAGVSTSSFVDCLRDRFKYFYDLAEPYPQQRPTREVSGLFEKYAGLAYSDLLLIN
jgi:hypothetical protein